MVSKKENLFCSSFGIRHSPLTVGLLGGSFNPAHAGHLYISQHALKCLGLSEVWWLVTPQHPLKPSRELAAYAERLASARAVAAGHARVRVREDERYFGTSYTIDLLHMLQQHHPRTRFVWLMGADNLDSFHRWKGWKDIFATVPVAVFDRAPFSHVAPRSKAALCFSSRRIKGGKTARLACLAPPAWALFYMRRHPESSTYLRKMLGKGAFFRHNEGGKSS